MKAEQLVIDTMCYTDFPLERALSGIADAGVSRVELCASVGSCNHAAPEHLGPRGSAKVQRLLEENGLTAVSLSAHADITTESGLIDFTSRLQLTAELGIPIINTPLPPDREHHRPDLPLRSGPEVDDLFCGNILKLGRSCRQARSGDVPRNSRLSIERRQAVRRVDPPAGPSQPTYKLRPGRPDVFRPGRQPNQG